MNNFVNIDIDSYNELIMNNRFYRDEIERITRENKVYKETFYKTIFDKNDYELSKIEDIELEDYYVRKIISDVFEFGNISIDEIILEIKRYKQIMDSEKEESEDSQ